MAAAEDQIREFDRITKVLTTSGLVRATNPLGIKRLGGGRVRVASMARGDEHTTHVASGSLRERVQLDESGAFAWKLIDGALIQLMWEFDRAGGLIKHRFAFLPSPIPAPSDDQQDVMSLAERMGSFLDEVADELCLGGAFRVDYDAAAATDTHPATHLTLFGAGLEEGRTPIKGPWCLTRFTQFVFCLVAPPTVLKDGKRQIDPEIQRALTQLSVATGRRDLSSPHDEQAWIGWGKLG